MLGIHIDDHRAVMVAANGLSRASSVAGLLVHLNTDG